MKLNECFTTPCSSQTNVASNAVLDTSNEDISASPLSHVFSNVEDESVVDHSECIEKMFEAAHLKLRRLIIHR